MLKGDRANGRPSEKQSPSSLCKEMVGMASCYPL